MLLRNVELPVLRCKIFRGLSQLAPCLHSTLTPRHHFTPFLPTLSNMTLSAMAECLFVSPLFGQLQYLSFSR